MQPHRAVRAGTSLLATIALMACTLVAVEGDASLAGATQPSNPQPSTPQLSNPSGQTHTAMTTSTSPASSLPPLDLRRPSHTETATFALG